MIYVGNNDIRPSITQSLQMFKLYTKTKLTYKLYKQNIQFCTLSQNEERTAGYANVYRSYKHFTPARGKVISHIRNSSSVGLLTLFTPCYYLERKNTAALYTYHCDLGTEIFRVDFPVLYLNMGGIWAESSDHNPVPTTLDEKYGVR